jgi:hypothetical protein
MELQMTRKKPSRSNVGRVHILYFTISGLAFRQACVPDARDVPAFHDDGGNCCDPGNGDNSCADNDGDNSHDSGNDDNDEPVGDGECYSKTPVWQMP